MWIKLKSSVIGSPYAGMWIGDIPMQRMDKKMGT